MYQGHRERERERARKRERKTQSINDSRIIMSVGVDNLYWLYWLYFCSPVQFRQTINIDDHQYKPIGTKFVVNKITKINKLPFKTICTKAVYCHN